MAELSIADVRRGAEFLYSSGRGYLELSAIPVDRGEGRFPQVSYVRGVDAVMQWARRSEGLLLCGVQPRPRPLRGERGFVRAAVDADIEVVETVFLDFDYASKVATGLQWEAAAAAWLDGAVAEYCLDLGSRLPARSFSGRGVHLFFASAPVSVSLCPDVRERLRAFRDGFVAAHREGLSRLELECDNTQDLSRKVRLPGTAKPSVGVLSCFYGERVEDAALREYLLSLSVPEPRAGGLRLAVGGGAPSWLPSLLERDAALGRLWRGDKDGGDVSQSGVDYSVARRLLRLGYTDVSEVARALLSRPGTTAVEKGEGYVRRTIGEALKR